MSFYGHSDQNAAELWLQIAKEKLRTEVNKLASEDSRPRAGPTKNTFTIVQQTPSAR